ncbi:hypothetical protein [Streptomyces sp. NPDC006285]|uniref:hypothetical protein n=1 Tax=Streptomyces sp. NPDC006285 TaxID=3364742 RepID=UPI0036CA3834
MLREQRRVDLGKSDLVDLCYSCFGGDLTLKIGDADFSILTGGGVQILDFAVEFFSAARSLVQGKSSRITFAGMADELFLTLSGESVEVSSNYVDDTSEAPREKIVMASRAFLLKVLTDLTAKYPELKRNRDVKKAGSWVGLSI